MKISTHLPKNYLKFLFVVIFLFFYTTIFSQTKLQLVQAQTQEYDKKLGEKQRFKGNVIIEHDGALLYCDSAWLFSETNSLETFGRSRIKVNDTVSLMGDRMFYDGNSRVATVTGKVVLMDNKSSITTDKLVYDRNLNTAYYNTGGILKDPANVLTSKIGNYNTNTKETFFKENVVLINSRYTITTDTLMFNTKTEIAYFFSSTNIVSKENRAYCEKGWYNTKNDKSVLQNNAILTNGKQTIKGDSLFYDKKTNFAKGYYNVSLFDSVQNVSFKGHYAEYKEKGGVSYIVDSALAIFVEKLDTLFLHADTLKVIFDTAQNPKMIYCYNRVKFFRTELQGKCDSLVYIFDDSTMTMYAKPIIWSGDNQLIADTIEFFFKEQKLYKMNLKNSAFLISAVDITRFNQIKGKNMEGFFVDNKIYNLDVLGNAESVYFITDDLERLVGVNKTESSIMNLFFDDNKVESILVSGKPKSSMSPEEKLNIQELKLKNFSWQIKNRPNEWKEIFSKIEL